MILPRIHYNKIDLTRLFGYSLSRSRVNLLYRKQSNKKKEKAMADIIDLKGHRTKQEDIKNAGKVRNLREMIHCSQCGMHCAKCGNHGEPTNQVSWSSISFRLCPACTEEFEIVSLYRHFV